jgi:CRP/FNR family cyclic AMP-dependent transcriptional regulator
LGIPAYIIASTLLSVGVNFEQGCWPMREILDYCTGGNRREVPAGSLVLREGTKTGRLFVLIEGRLEVIRGNSVVAVLAEPGAVTGEMSLLLDRPHTATVRAAVDSTIYEINDASSFLDEHPAVARLIAQLLAQRLNVATTYLADLMKQYAGHGTHLEMISELLQSMISLPPQQVSPGSDRQSDPRM